MGYGSGGSGKDWGKDEEDWGEEDKEDKEDWGKDDKKGDAHDEACSKCIKGFVAKDGCGAMMKEDEMGAYKATPSECEWMWEKCDEDMAWKYCEEKGSGDSGKDWGKDEEDWGK